MKTGRSLAVWLLVGLVGASLHFGPAQKLVARERVGAALAEISRAEADAARLDTIARERTRERVAAKRRVKETNSPRDIELAQSAISAEKAAWTAAREAWTAIAGSIAGVESSLNDPSLQERTRLTLRRARAISSGGKPGAALGEIESLLTKLDDAGDADSSEADNARAELADAYYHAALSYRANARPEDQWRPLTATSRQHYRYLAERATAKGNSDDADRARRNLEVVLNLEQATADELEATPTPTDCENCNAHRPSPKRGDRPEKGQSDGSGIEGDGW